MKYHAYTKGGCLQIRDEQENIVMIFPTIGCGYRTNQSHEQARRRAHKFARILSGQNLKQP